MGLGAPVSVALTSSETIAVNTSFVTLTSSGGTMLKTITPSNAGDVLVLKAAPSFTPTVTETGGNLKLNGTSFPFGTSGNDSLTLLCAGSTWLEIARSSNG